MLLQVQVLSSDAQAVHFAFRLLAKSDGHSGETLDILLGRLIRISPRLFLTALREHRPGVRRLDSLLGNAGMEYVDRLPARAYEIGLRRKALLMVKDPTLFVVRNECLKALADSAK